MEPNNHLLTVSSQCQDQTSQQNKLSSITDCVNRIGECTLINILVMKLFIPFLLPFAFSKYKDQVQTPRKAYNMHKNLPRSREVQNIV